MNHTKEQLDALKIRLALDKPNLAYKIISDNRSNNSASNFYAKKLSASCEFYKKVCKLLFPLTNYFLRFYRSAC